MEGDEGAEGRHQLLAEMADGGRTTVQAVGDAGACQLEECLFLRGGEGVGGWVLWLGIDDVGMIAHNTVFLTIGTVAGIAVEHVFHMKLRVALGVNQQGEKA